MFSRRDLGLLIAGGSLGLAAGAAVAGDAVEPGPWADIREALFAGRPIEDGRDVLALEAPVRAYDAAVVPIAVRQLGPGSGIRTVHLIVDRNPAPVAVVFHLPPGGRADLSARLRVNEYTPVRAIAETTDGRLWMVERFVKAAGGCSAPATKDKAAAMARLGRMKLKPQGTLAAGTPLPVELLISHPQYTGMQIDQVSRNWIPPDHLTRIAVQWNDRRLLDIDADISLSEDPALGFTLLPDGPGTLSVAADDSEGRHFEQSWPLQPGL
jgi:sulfur-oxidizing protein SoxY